MVEIKNHNLISEEKEPIDTSYSQDGNAECNGRCDHLMMEIFGIHRDRTEEEVRQSLEKLDQITQELHDRYKNGTLDLDQWRKDIEETDKWFYQQVRKGKITKEEIFKEGGSEWIEEVRQGLLAGKGLGSEILSISEEEIARLKQEATDEDKME